MRRVKPVVFSLIIALCLVTTLTVLSFAAGEGTKTITGNVVCLLPDYEKGSVNPVIATGSCSHLPPHQHVMVTEKGTVYSLQGLQDGLIKIQEMPDKTDVPITGKVEGNNYGWILIVD